MTNNNNSKHRDGQKWFWVRWELDRSCGREYWLVYTESAAEDDKLLADGRWEKISRDFAIDLTKRGGQRWNTALDICNGDWLWHTICDAQRDKGKEWIPVFPFRVDNNADYKIKDRVVVKC